MSTKTEKERDFASLTAYIYSSLTDSPRFFMDIDNVMDIAKAFIKEYPTGTDWELTENDWETTVFEFYEAYDKMNAETKFREDHEIINPKQMVTFIDLFRKQELYMFNKKLNTKMLLTKSDEEYILTYINSGNCLFGKKK
jgi:hypothetical protein